ncbi:MAG: nitrous oxide-stimulated promoter family protein [Burkholderiales bacterium]|jgi:hypothetical protein|nr:nitrous oxide-stimulated promoter family protein [Burkholderiales bacterium]
MPDSSLASPPVFSDKRRQREAKTVTLMIDLYCRRHHGQTLCESCEALQQYAMRRLSRCVFGADKPTCAKCTVHCYSKTLQAHMREVMRDAGPRMLWSHPYLAIMHLMDNLRRAPTLQEVITRKRA